MGFQSIWQNLPGGRIWKFYCGLGRRTIFGWFFSITTLDKVTWAKLPISFRRFEAMAQESKAKHFSDALKFDTRLVEYSINRGLLTREEVEQHLKNLPDSGANAEFIKMDDMGNQSDGLDQTH
ncbi:MAG: hypothetical protein WCH11_05260 [Bdellovibrio sp.]